MLQMQRGLLLQSCASSFPFLSFLGWPTLAKSLGSFLCFSHCCGKGRKSASSPTVFPSAPPLTPDPGWRQLSPAQWNMPDSTSLPQQNRSRRVSQNCIPGVKELMSRIRRIEKGAEQWFAMGGVKGEWSLSVLSVSHYSWTVCYLW